MVLCRSPARLAYKCHLRPNPPSSERRPASFAARTPPLLSDGKSQVGSVLLNVALAFIAATAAVPCQAQPMRGRWSDEGHLLPKEVTAARLALADRVGIVQAGAFRILSEGCGFPDLTYVVRRSVQFVRVATASDLGVVRSTHVPCAATPKTAWSCRTPYSVASLALNGERHEFEVSESLNDQQIVQLVSYARSECFYRAMQPYLPSNGSHPSPGRTPLWSARKVETGVFLVLSNGGYGYDVELTEGNSDCPFRVVKAGYWIT